jgi:hypothetical protein
MAIRREYPQQNPPTLAQRHRAGRPGKGAGLCFREEWKMSRYFDGLRRNPMRFLRHASLGLALFTLALLALLAAPQTASAQQPTPNQFTPLNVPFASGINDRGQIIGFYSSGSGFDAHGLVYEHGVSTPLPDVPGAIQTLPYGINDRGQIAGIAFDSDSDFNFFGHGFVYDHGVYTILDYPGAFRTFLNGMNDQGQIVGFYLRDWSDNGGTFLLSR